MLRCVTWLAPGLPLELFELASTALATDLGVDFTLESRTESSGPEPDDDPFARDEADVGFMCAPSFRRLTSVALVAAPVFDDPRAGGEPVYFSELVVRDSIAASSLHDLEGRRVGYNDRASLSGYQVLLDHLHASPVDVYLVHTGGHRQSLRMLASGEIDAAAIDSNTLLALGPDGLPSGLRVVDTWGPHPVQPVVARRSLDPAQRDRMTKSLVSMAADSKRAAGLRSLGVERFVAVNGRHYDTHDDVVN
jgi:ABC-type phosphate/phosphonate transport system substrate-binding protein